jgi:hypothetical protein
MHIHTYVHIQIYIYTCIYTDMHIYRFPALPDMIIYMNTSMYI